MKTAIIDNYDSFTFNLVHYVLHTGAQAEVFRNDKISVEALAGLGFDAIILSPGPGRPEDAGICLELVQKLSGTLPILGVCLGHQAIAQSFGGTIIHAKSIMHGKTSVVQADGKHIFSGINKPFNVMRYHSLAVQESDLPDCLEVTARTLDGEIMGIRHREHPTQGVQFHPESFMTTVGKRLIRNFIKGA
ncbi:anthranilate synthase component II [Desulfobacter postgatei]|uniref:Glutamine amidotransferase of anthranilate synthase or aminodeoxychorismate synthase n=1 Tax=Desulfobacter postgatei 2ac9 TaxID=879212 RepID=I5B2L8_9BACT|nr:aminodeoxychorismate/anthranilate synthase component II [Desulfobacter postgatei]EIM63731.1 glutamine amidotransferase of anthranilate synthase or aminodeoxychorismate synthase [Desulfobacter postgatei 2ac9]